MEKFKLNRLSENRLKRREMRELIGGTTCGCGCKGPSSNLDNGTANHDVGLNSEGSMTDLTWYLDEVVVTP